MPVRLRYVGQDDPVAEKIFRLAASREEAAAAAGKGDSSITTLFVGGLPEGTRETQLLQQLRPFGEVLAVRINPLKKVAFVCFAERAAAAAALQQLAGQLVIGGATMRLAWARPKASAEAAADSSSSSSSSAAAAAVPEGYLAPPVPGLPPLPLPMGAPGPPPAVLGAPVPYRSMLPSEAELSRR
ncbi:hypothetical protein, conserved [Eimeria tenella]|uniref:RRM domain-containing protein n=1 Tax=Eimeria tenella TaxID=5802 RepID=U6LCM2_EIMTE|nr:hypothetical protein, conserved [Eimeria tenella]CDJ45495.1 hypothetical protein, conserved [Eimeria tenella]|eukprot:XP_013236241.1 hypothetical protein, conserved [Eimeria tenella]